MVKTNVQTTGQDLNTNDSMISSATGGSTGIVETTSTKDHRTFPFPRPPPHVYSCFVVNGTKDSIECDLHYDGRPGEEQFNEDIHVVIPSNEEKFFPRKFFQPDLPESYCKWVKIVTGIRIKTQDGNILQLKYPFDQVSSPVRNWEFHVTDQGEILSKPPTRPANLLKYESLDEYER